MSWNKALLAVFLAIIALIVAAIIYANSIDFNQYKATLVEELEKASGRDVAIDGEIRLSFGIDSAFVIDGLRIGNPNWATRDDMIRVGRIEARFPVGSLLSGALRIDRLALYDVDLWLETKGPKRANWFFIGGEPRSVDKATPKGPHQANRNLLGMLGVGGIDVSGARVSYRDAESGLIQVLELNHGSVIGDGFSKPMEIDSEGIWNGLPLTLRGQVGSLEELVREGGASYNVDLVMTLGGVQVTASGNFANPNDGSGVNLAMKARADSLQGLVPVLGDVAGRLKHMTLTASVTYIRERFVMGDIRFGVGDSSMTGNLSIDFAPTVPVFDAVFNAPRIDLSALSGKSAGEPAMVGSPQDNHASPIISREVLPWDIFGSVNGRLAFRGSTVQVAGITLHGVDLDATLRDGELRLAPFHGKLAESDIEATGTIARDGNGGRFTLAMRAPRLAVGALFERFETVRSFEGAAKVNLTLSGSGDSIGGLLGSMSGDATLQMERGKLMVDLPGAGAKALSVGPGAVFGMLVPKHEGGVLVRCAILRVIAQDGILQSTGTVVESDAAVVVAEGQVDLAKERVDLRISPRSKGPGLWLATPVQLTGSLAAPQFGAVPGADPANEGGALSPLAVFFDRLLSSTDNACLEAGRDGRRAGKPGGRTGPRTTPAE